MGHILKTGLVINRTFATDKPYKGSHCFKWGFLTINAEKMWPWGMTPRCPSSVILVSVVVMTGVRAGVHSKTKTYMEPSNRDCINPRQRILWSERDEKIISNWINKQNTDHVSLKNVCVCLHCEGAWLMFDDKVVYANIVCFDDFVVVIFVVAVVVVVFYQSQAKNLVVWKKQNIKLNEQIKHCSFFFVFTPGGGGGGGGTLMFDVWW